MPGEGFLVAAWAAGVVEGVSLLSLARKNPPADQPVDTNVTKASLMIVPAVLYGTLSLPLSLIGAAPGPTLIRRLPFVPNIEALEDSLLPPRVSTSPSPLAAEVQSQAIQKGKRRQDLLRAENRSRYLASSSSAPPSSLSPTIHPTSKTAATRYISTLDGHALLPTPVAESMRRSRFLFAGAGLVTMMISYQAKLEEERRKRIEEALENRRNGKDASAIRQLVESSQQGAVVRWCDSVEQVSHTKNSGVAIIPLFSNSNGNYFLKTPQNDKFSEAVLVLNSLVATARKHDVLTSKVEAVKVVLSCCKPALPISSQDVYVDAHSALGVQVNSVLERMHREVEAELVGQRDLHVLEDDPSNVIEMGSEQSPEQRRSTSPVTLVSSERAAREYLVWVVNESILFVDMIGSSIRHAASLCMAYLAEVRGDKFRSHRVIHVLSDQQPFVEFLQMSLRDWRIVWYDANKGSDVELYKNSGGAISVVCCGNDLTTSALLAATTTMVSKPTRVLAILAEPTGFIPLGVSTIYIHEVHNALFSHIRGLLAEGKAPVEVQEIVDLIR
ncbi:hypothetical protein MHU86_24077 [Fragilaria crotonensis]|nr:hypothetical protein MHU86_24077 [Fragilaria crotonensis]